IDREVNASGDPQDSTPTQREQQLLADHAGRWLSNSPDWARPFLCFRRGFPEELRLDQLVWGCSRSLLQRWTELPVHGLYLQATIETSVQEEGEYCELVERLVPVSPVSTPELRMICQAPAAARLCSLTLFNHPLTDVDLEVLTGAAGLASLRELRVAPP